MPKVDKTKQKQKIDHLNTPRKALMNFFLPERLERLFSLKDVKPFPDRKMIKLLTFNTLFPSLRHTR